MRREWNMGRRRKKRVKRGEEGEKRRRGPKRRIAKSRREVETLPPPRKEWGENTSRPEKNKKKTIRTHTVYRLREELRMVVCPRTNRNLISLLSWKNPQSLCTEPRAPEKEVDRSQTYFPFYCHLPTLFDRHSID